MKTAFVFPGQGSQSIGMLSAIAQQDDIIEQTFAEASDVLGYDLWQLVQQGEPEKLNQTEITQPALLTASVALWRLFEKNTSTRPEFVAGHSLGEYSALVCAQVIEFKEAVKLVQLRGQYMQQAVPAGEGGMAAIIGLSDDLVKQACAEAAEDQVVSAVNFNSPGQIVIAGNKAAVDRACVLCKDKGAKRALPLNVSAPSHCSLMAPAAKLLEQKLADIEFRSPVIAVVQNVCAQQEQDPVIIKKNLVDQLYQPVLWTDSIEFLSSQSVGKIIECGPGKVLSGLNRRIDKTMSVFAIEQWETLQSAIND